ncbi:hypothetical protein BH11ACT6_BH11ACT6_21950 [soil metagenome]
MKKLLIVPAVVAAAIGLSAPAYAGEQEYLADLEQNASITGADAALQMGYEVCTDISHGVPEPTTVEAIFQGTPEDFTVADAQFIYDAAAIYLCG